MKLNHLPIGARFEYEGQIYTETGPITAAAEKGGQRMIPRHAVLRPVDGHTPPARPGHDPATRRKPGAGRLRRLPRHRPAPGGRPRQSRAGTGPGEVSGGAGELRHGRAERQAPRKQKTQKKPEPRFIWACRLSFEDCATASGAWARLEHPAFTMTSRAL